MTEPQDGLSIGELARRTEVPAATLRSWEDRYGFPRPHRLAGGHRRYDHGDIGLIEAVVRLRAAGMSLQTAIGQATSAAGQPEPSVFAGLRSEYAYMAGLASIGLSFLAWTTSLKAEKAGTDRADRWGIFIGHWAPTFFGLGNALRSYEK